jgi:hypothetical protein
VKGVDAEGAEERQKGRREGLERELSSLRISKFCIYARSGLIGRHRSVDAKDAKEREGSKVRTKRQGTDYGFPAFVIGYRQTLIAT